MGVMNWMKWTKVLTTADEKFIDTYNFKIPLEDKTPELVSNLAYVTLFEESRLNKILPPDFTPMVQGMSEKLELYKYIIPVGPSSVDWVAYESFYTFYISNRAKRLEPLEALREATNAYYGEEANTDRPHKEKLKNEESSYHQEIRKKDIDNTVEDIGKGNLVIQVVLGVFVAAPIIAIFTIILIAIFT